MTNRLDRTQTPPKFSTLEGLTVLSCSLLFIGFFYSEIVLSVGMILLILCGFRPKSLAIGWRRFRRHLFCWWALLFCLAYLVSGLWAKGSENWWLTVQTKIPFAFLPFAILNLPFHKKRIQLWVMLCILIILFAGMLYDLSFIAIFPNLFLKGRHIPSVVGEDYIRLTMALALAAQMALYLWKQGSKMFSAKWIKPFLVLWLVVAVVYIHLQASKTGLICFYLFVVVNAVQFFTKKYKLGWFKTAVVLGFAAAVLLLSFQLIPSIRWQYNKAVSEMEIWHNDQKARQLPKGYSIIPRLISYEMAWKNIESKPLLGVGAGNLQKATNQQYQKYFPDRGALIPHNQYLCTAVLVGLPMTLFLLLMVLWPLTKSSDVNVISTVLIMVVGTLVSPMFELQLGVFVFLFFTLFWMSAFKTTRVARIAVSKHS